METKVFHASSIRRALAKVRDEFGPDALIVDQVEGDGVVEVHVATEERDDGSAQVLASRVRERLAKAGFNDVVINSGLRGSWPEVISQLAARVRVAHLSRELANGAYRLIGPPGAGKTTLACKLIAGHVAAYGASSVKVVATDSWRLGASEPLLALAELLKIDVVEARTPLEIKRCVDTARDKLLIVDSPGAMDVERVSSPILAPIQGVEDVLVLPVIWERGVLREVLKRFALLSPSYAALTFTEIGSLVPLLSEILACDLPIAWLSAGQTPFEGLSLPEPQVLERAIDSIDSGDALAVA